MKVNVEIDCTPEEARRFMGLPDLAPVQERYVAKLADMAEGGIKPEAIEALIRNWGPMGESGLGLWRSLFEAGTRKDPPS
ncbi:DUF6489 family protein [Sphingomonas bacterium]|uniref:DUF6489 family protein n=1 Tax=Sphingomonas bacterium TaxID=1895847 RepID=UPI0015759C14|nr:DUF6489 family protein [Sphingomonas bacterium]